MKTTKIGPLAFSLLMLCALGIQVAKADENLPSSAFEEIMWDDLLPLDYANEALSSPPNVHSPDYQQSPVPDADFLSRVLETVVPELNDKAVRIPGFVVPLEFDDSFTITEFFLVPYFGACIHSPAPPPNQIIYVNHQEGVTIESIYTPYWVSGVMSTALVENELGASAYSIEMQNLEEYEW